MDTSTPSDTAPAEAATTRPPALVCFSYGMTKCGSTLAFEMARTILEQAGCPQPRLDGAVVADWSGINFAEDLSPARVAGLVQAVAAVGHQVVVKLHGACTPAARALVRDGQARAHAVYRDPRDMALSLLDAGAQARAAGRPAFAEIATLDDALAAVRRQHRTLCTWLRVPAVMPLFYDDVAFDPLATITRLARHLGVAAEPERVLAVVEGERFTQRNRAVRARHLDEMQAAESRRIATEFAPLTRVAIDARRKPFAGQGAAYMAWRRSLAAAARDHVKQSRAGGQAPAQAAQPPSTMQPAPKAAKDGATE